MITFYIADSRVANVNSKILENPCWLVLDSTLINIIHELIDTVQVVWLLATGLL